MSRFEVEVCEMKPITVDESELMTLSEAAKIMGLSYSSMTGLLKRRVLRRIVDKGEPNPTWANRVLITEVRAEMKRRQQRQDARLKGKRDERTGGR